MRASEGVVHYTVGEVADRVGVSRQTLRDWEAKGLLTPSRSSGGQRLFNQGDLARAAQIARTRMRARRVAAGGRDGAGRTVRALVGTRIRAFREERGLTLGELGARCGASPSFLSTLERNECGVSMEVLSRIAGAFGLPLSALGPALKPDVQPVGPADRIVTEILSDFRWEELAATGGPLEPSLLVVAAGAGSDGFYQRPGTTFVFVLEGRIEFQLESSSDAVVLEAEHALTLPPHTGFAWTNAGSTAARALWVEHIPARMRSSQWHKG